MGVKRIKRRMKGPLYRQDLNATKCQTPGCNCGDGDIFFHSGCESAGHPIEIGCDHESHLLLIGCGECRAILKEFALSPGGFHDDGGCVWGYEDWSHLSEGHRHTFIRLRSPCEIAYDRAAGEVYVCEGEVMTYRFSIAMRAN